jgi:hypothetical protein
MIAALNRASFPLCLLLSAILCTEPLSGEAAVTDTSTENPQTTEQTKERDEQPGDALNNSDLVSLSQSKQALAGLQTQALVKGHYQTEWQASASVIDIQPLLMSREQYLAAQIDVQSATAALALAQQAINRTQELYRNGVNSQRQLQEQHMAHSVAFARLTSSQQHLQSITDSLAANWGNTLSSWAKASHSPEFADFINGQQALLLISLPAGISLPKGLTHIDVSPTGERQSPQTAHLIASAPQGSEVSQGETYFFRTSRTKLRTGMRLSAWIAAPEQTLSGFIIPAAALIWHAGVASIYLKTAPEQFKRISLNHYQPIAKGYFVAEALIPNAEIVTTGAQILLSHEFRALIPIEDNDGDD